MPGRLRLAPAGAALLLALAACANRQPPPAASVAAQQGAPPDLHVPDYAKRPFEPFSRVNAIAIAQREWRAFGNLVDDDPPGRSTIPPALRYDRQPGLWQRVGDYWWFGQDAGTPQSGWTGKYTEFGTPYAGEPPAWSAAFISYVMRAAGAADRFAYSPLHADYINAAARGEGALRAASPDRTPPTPGDLICYGRQNARSLQFADLPAPRFFGHCDIVVQAQPGQLTVIGGNVATGVTMKHVPTTDAGLINGRDGRPVDSRYPWFVVLQVGYDDPAS